MRKMVQKRKKTDCKFFKSGNGFCRKKNSCKFGHFLEDGQKFVYEESESEEDEYQNLTPLERHLLGYSIVDDYDFDIG